MFIFKKNNLFKSAFTLSELLIALAVVGILVAVVFPVVARIMPDQNTIMAKRAYAVTQSALSEMLNGPCYPEKSNRLGLDDGYGYLKCAQWNDNTVESNAGDKLVSLFTGYLDLKNGSLNKSTNTASFQTKDGMLWTFANLDKLNGDYKNKKSSYITLSVDTNGSAKNPNCGQSNKSGLSNIQCEASVTKGFDTFTMLIFQNGRILIDDRWAQLAVRTDKKFHGDTDDLTSGTSFVDDEISAIIEKESQNNSDDEQENNSVDCSEPPLTPNLSHECCDDIAHPNSAWLNTAACDECYYVSSSSASLECCNKWNSNPASYSVNEDTKSACCNYVSSMCQEDAGYGYGN